MSALFKNELNNNVMCLKESTIVQSQGICTTSNLGLYEYDVW